MKTITFEEAFGMKLDDDFGGRMYTTYWLDVPAEGLALKITAPARKLSVAFSPQSAGGVHHVPEAALGTLPSFDEGVIKMVRSTAMRDGWLKIGTGGFYQRRQTQARPAEGDVLYACFRYIPNRNFKTVPASAKMGINLSLRTG